MWQKIALCLGSVLLTTNIANANDIIDFSTTDRIKIIGNTDEYRTTNLTGQMGSKLNIYGNTDNNKTMTINISNIANKDIFLYAGYNDDPLADNITGNIINVTDNTGNWGYYENNYTNATDKVVLNSLDGDLQLNLVAGHGSAGNVTNNTINLYGGSLNGLVIAAETTDSTDANNRLTGNSINIYGNGDYSQAELCGAAIVSYNNHLYSILPDTTTASYSYIQGTNNALNIFVENQTLGTIVGFSTINYYLPESVRNGSNILLGNYDLASIENATINAFVNGGIELYVGDVVNLLATPTSIYEDDGTTYTQYMENITAGYDYYMGKPETNLMLLRVTGKTVRQQSKVILASRRPLLPTQVADLLTDEGVLESQAAATRNLGQYNGFFALRHSNLNFNTDIDTDLNSTTLVFGASKYIDSQKKAGHRQLLAPLFEYGYGSYTEYFSQGIRGNGAQYYHGLGYLARGEKPNKSYQEAMLRLGQLNIDFHSDSMLVHDKRISTKLNSKSFYAGGHLAIGREVTMPNRNHDKFEYYGRFLWGITNKDHAKLSSGERYTFSQVNSYRLRLGTKYSQDTHNQDTVMAELAAEYELDGKVRGSYQDLPLPEISSRGMSTLVQLSYEHHQRENDPSTALQLGYSFGKRRGLSINGGINWSFT